MSRADAIPDTPEEEAGPVSRAVTPGGGPEHSGRPGRNLGLLALSQLITWVMTAAWTVIVPRELGPEGLGVIVTVTSISGVFGLLLGLGSQVYLVRELVRDRSKAGALLGTAIVLRILLAPLMAAAAVAFAQLAHYHHLERVALYLATATAVVTLLTQVLQAGFQATERMQYLAYSNVFNKSAQSVAGVAVVLLGFRTLGVLAGTALLTAAAALLNVIWLVHYLPIDLRTTPKSLWRMSKDSFVYWAGNVFSLVYLWIDTIMLSLMTNARVVGWYGATTTLFQTLLAFAVLVSTAWLPRFVLAFERSPDDLNQAARQPIEIVLALSLPLAAGTALFAHVIVIGFYGHEFTKAVPVMIALAVCIVPMNMNILLSQVAAAAGRQRIWTWLMAMAVAVNPALNLVLIPLTQRHLHNGAIGAAWAMVLTEVIQNGIGFVLIGRNVLDKASYLRILGAGLASGAMLAAYYFARPVGAAPALTVAVLSLLLGLLLFRAVRPHELQLARSVVAARLGGRRA